MDRYRKFTSPSIDLHLKVAEQLMKCSKWYDFCPLPDGDYQITVKNEPSLPNVVGVVWRPI